MLMMSSVKRDDLTLHAHWHHCSAIDIATSRVKGMLCQGL